MKYRWDKNELNKRLLAAKESKDYDLLDNISYMLDLLEDMHDDKFANQNTDNEDLMIYYTDGIEKIADSTFDRCIDIFTIASNIDEIYTKVALSKINLSNKDLIDLGYEIIASLKDKRALQIYHELTRQDRSYLNIATNIDEIYTNESEGVIIHDNNTKKSYINIKREYNIQDLEALIHEVMHAIMYKYTRNKIGYLYGYFSELEGKFGEILTSQFLKEHDMKKYADEIDFHNYSTVTYQSFMAYLTDVLIYTANEETFDVDAANVLINKEIPFKDFKVTDEEIPFICNRNGFDTVTNIINYMMCLELRNKYSPEDQFLLLQQYKKIDDYDFYNKQLKQLFDFYQDKNKQLIDEKNRLNKKIRVL